MSKLVLHTKKGNPKGGPALGPMLKSLGLHRGPKGRGGGGPDP